MRTFSRLAAAAALAVACLTMAPSPAFADEAAAETMFQEGLAAMKRNDYAVAAEAFTQSNKADPSPGTQINLALSYEKQKKWASAWTWYRSALGLAQQRNQAARAQNAEDSAARIKPLIHYAIISVKEPLTGLVVKRDGAEVTIAIAGKEVPLPIDPGEHTIEVSASGKKPWSKTVQIADNPQTERIEVPKLEDAPVEVKPVAAGAADYRPPVVTSDGSTQRTVGIVVGGAGILSGVAAIFVLTVAHSEAEERDVQRKAQNDPTLSTDARAEAKTSADSHAKAADNNELIAIGLGVGAGVLVGVGAVLFFTAPKAAAKAAHSPVMPLITPTFAGLGLGGSF